KRPHWLRTGMTALLVSTLVLALGDGPAAQPKGKGKDKGGEQLLPKEGDWETLPDGTTGKTTTFKGKDGMLIGAYLRKPKAEWPPASTRPVACQAPRRCSTTGKP